MKTSPRDAWHHALLGWLNLALTAPSIYLWLGLPLILRQQGWTGMELGVFQLAGLPAIFKFAMAAPLERYRLAGSQYRNWAILLCLLLTLILLMLGRQDLLSSPGALFALAMAAALMATWADIPVNALAIRLLPEAQRMRAGGVRSAALSAGSIVGGGLMLLLQNQFGWHAPFWSMAGFLASAAGLLLTIKEPASKADTATEQHPQAALMQFQAYLSQAGARAWTCLLLLCFPFVGTAWFYLKPLLLDSGFTIADIAKIAGMGGGAIAAVASLLAASVCKRIGAIKAIPACALLNLVSLSTLSLVVCLNLGSYALLLAALMLAIALGSSASLAFGLMMYFTRTNRNAIDYSLQASLFAMSRMAVPLAAGVLLDFFGYRGMLLALTLASAGVLVLALKNRQVVSAVVQQQMLAGGAT
ncbi:MFS transporter [Undibacterium sp. JH2W]|uniref:MFS transporter n=1 Tax=Undibacterium sp. JH2W TaxID=3413037 RepID=UPI003BF3BCBC